jgi:hypothetical protein
MSESSEAFEQGIEIGDEDPFAGSDFGDWEQPSEVPSEVRPPQPTTYSDAPPVEASPQNAGSPAEPAEVAPRAPAEPAPVAAQEPLSEAEAPVEVPVAAEPQSAPQTAAEAVEAPAPPPAPAPAPEPEPDEDDDTDDYDEDLEPEEDDIEMAAGNGDAPLPVETKDRAGRTNRRRYILLRVDADGDKFTRLTWYEDKQRNVVSRNTTGAKRQTVVLARDADDAIRFGFVAAGAPAKGIQLVAVAAQNFQPRMVAPVPPEPQKIRLRIS